MNRVHSKLGQPPRVSIIIPNLNGQECLEHCLAAVSDLEYSQDLIECVVVDNGSVDGSAYFVKKYYPAARIQCLQKNIGYAAAINNGAGVASGEILFFLNNDAQPKPDCLTHLIDPIASGDTVCTAAKIVSPAGGCVQFARGGTNFHGVGFQHGEGEPDRDEFAVVGPTLFACGGAMAIRRDVFFEAGGMDEDFFAYFEDVDLGWRLWIMGYNVIFAPRAIVTHWQSATSRFIDLTKIRVLHVRNPLVMIYKNYSDDYLRSIFPVAWMLSVRRAYYLSSAQAESYRIGDEPHLAESNPMRHEPPLPAIPEDRVPFPAIAVSDLVALNDWLNGFEALAAKRAEVQRNRVRADSEIVPMFIDPFRYSEHRSDYKKLQDDLCLAFGINELFGQ